MGVPIVRDGGVIPSGATNIATFLMALNDGTSPGVGVR